MKVDTLGRTSAVFLVASLYLVSADYSEVAKAVASHACLEYGVDFDGKEIFRVPVSDVVECRSLCAAEANCSFFNLLTVSSICILRSGLPYLNIRTRNNRLTELKGCQDCGHQDTAYEGETLISNNAYSPTHCEFLCSANEGCESFTFDTNSKSCSLYKKGANLKSEKNMISGRRSCSGEVDEHEAPKCSVRRMEFGGVPLLKSNEINATACQQSCRNSSRCEAFAYNIVSRECRLHLANAEGKKTPNSIFISGPKECNIECQKHDENYESKGTIMSISSGISTAEECHLRCQATSGCNNWSYDTGARNCNLIKEVNKSAEAKGVISGPKFCIGACDLRNTQSPGFDIYNEDGLTVEECRAVLHKHQGAVMFTRGEESGCYIKTVGALQSVSVAEGKTVGWEHCSQCIDQGFGYKTDGRWLLWKLKAENAEECKWRCSTMENCTRFTYNASHMDCSLLSGKPEKVHGDDLQSGPAECDADNSCMLNDVQWVNSENIATTTTPNAQACQAACETNFDCRFFTYEKRKQQCYLKTGLDQQIVSTPKTDWISGPKKCMHSQGLCEDAGYDYTGSDIDLQTRKVENTSECRDLCYKQPGCMVYTFSTKFSDCWLKRIVSFNKRSTESSTSGARLGCAQCLRAYLKYTGSVVKEVQLASPTLCQIACGAESRCNFFTHTKESCKLMQDEGQAEIMTSNLIVSGPKYC